MSASASEGTLVDEKTGTRIAEVSHGIFRVSAPIGAGKDLLDTPIATPFTNNLYVIKAEKPALYLTGFKQGFPALKKAVSSVVDVKSIRYIVLTLWARDQMGALRLWLDECPDAVLVCSKGMLATRAEPKGITRVKVRLANRARDQVNAKTVLSSR
jgi:glyoxylase-like metal-dependent hydrolase (beta-lactamase superfamily II)